MFCLTELNISCEASWAGTSQAWLYIYLSCLGIMSFIARVAIMSALQVWCNISVNQKKITPYIPLPVVKYTTL